MEAGGKQKIIAVLNFLKFFYEAKSMGFGQMILFVFQGKCCSLLRREALCAREPRLVIWMYKVELDEDVSGRGVELGAWYGVGHYENLVHR
jgi:hypothetical protein